MEGIFDAGRRLSTENCARTQLDIDDFRRRLTRSNAITHLKDAIQLRQYLLTAEGDALGTQLQKCWYVVIDLHKSTKHREPNLAAALALALWREKYELANELVQRM